MNQETVIKMVETSSYNTQLIEGADFKYYVRQECFKTGNVSWTHPINDYNTATYLFDLRLNDISKH